MATTKLATLQLADSRALSYAITSATTSSNENRPYVLLSNSLCAPFTVWDHVVPRLTALGFNVLRYDQPGHGESGVPKDLSSTTFDSMAEDVHFLLKHLGIVDKQQLLHAWIGVSMGAATGIVFAAKYPGVIGKLIACDTISSSPVNAGTPDAFGPRVAAAREAGDLDATIEGTLDRWLGRDWMGNNPEETARMRALMRRTTVDGFETCCAALTSETFDLRRITADAGRGVDAALLLVGENDANLPETMEELRRGIESGLKSKKGELSASASASVALELVPNAGHVCFVDGFDSFMEHVTKFLLV